MDAASGLFEVIFKLGLPVGVISFLMVRWFLNKGVLSERTGVKALRKEIDGLAKARKNQKKSTDENPQKLHPLQEKWLKFGGGFYGIVALYTYGLVEWNELRAFISDLGGLRELISNLDLNMVINIFVEALKNFITAIAWPAYWISEFDGRNAGILFGVAYGAYWLGMKAAQHYASKSP